MLLSDGTLRPQHQPVESLGVIVNKGRASIVSGVDPSAGLANAQNDDVVLRRVSWSSTELDQVIRAVAIQWWLRGARPSRAW